MMVLGGFLLYLSLLPVKIVAVHQSDNYSIALVENYPFSDSGKIEWWLTNKEMLKEKYNIPKVYEGGRYHIILWDFDEGYKKLDKYDRLCFDDMKPPKNCVDKNAIMKISRNKYGVTDFSVGQDIYVLRENGLIVKRERDW